MTDHADSKGAFNSAELKHALRPGGLEYLSEMHFVMQDNYHQFTLSLGTMLECLQVAEREGEVPPLPAEWWQLLQRSYRQLK
ncbi:hypothetical protein R3D73_005190 [Serratia marcescens]|nr:hypothetical protein [Serratia marcescens]ELQ9442281.1 hypothetical protein [Serratia marcescens]ELT5563041.1 hypothetical protein [Serratia marcescens]